MVGRTVASLRLIRQAAVGNCIAHHYNDEPVVRSATPLVAATHRIARFGAIRHYFFAVGPKTYACGCTAKSEADAACLWLGKSPCLPSHRTV